MKPEDVLAKNLNALMLARADLASNERLAAKSGIGSSTIDRVRKATVATSIDTVADIARAFGLPTWTLLIDELDPARIPALSYPGVGSPVGAVNEQRAGYNVGKPDSGRVQIAEIHRAARVAWGHASKEVQRWSDEAFGDLVCLLAEFSSDDPDAEQRTQRLLRVVR